MWICLNNAFFSIVRTQDVPDGCLRVRARRPGDIERYFPDAQVARTPGRDYLFRASIPAEKVAAVIAQAVAGIDYPNFKDAVRDGPLHDAYLDTWRAIGKIQNPRPYARNDN